MVQVIILAFVGFLCLTGESYGHPNGFHALRGLRAKRDDKVETHTDYGEMSFFEGTKLYACISDICQRIKEFSVSKAQKTCHEEYLPIVWDYDDPSNNSKTRAVSGYLTPDGSVLVEQKTSKECKMVKRYNYNDNKSLVLINEKVNEVDLDKCDAYIVRKLWDTGAYFSFILYYFGYFDNRDNTFSEKPFIKDILVVFVAFKLAIFIIRTVTNFFQRVQQTIIKVYEMMENYDKIIESAGKAKKSK